jgi:hypothetical protein
MPPLRPRDRRRAFADLQAAVGSVARPNPIIVMWRWRYELLLAIGVTATGVMLAALPATGWMFAGGMVVIAIIALSPPLRRRASARAWCVITPHRVRAGCAGAWIHSRSGKLPAVLLTTRQPFGERVTLWCPPGICAHDFDAVLPLLIAACWAQDIRVIYNDRYPHIVTLDVIRRPGYAWSDSARSGEPLEGYGTSTDGS